MALARSMIALDAALCSDGDRRSAARRLELGCEAVVDRITAACVAMQTAALILRTLQLEPSTAPQAADVMELAAGLVAVFSAGSASLEACRRVLLSALPGSLAAERAGARLGEYANHQVVASNAVLITVTSMAGSTPFDTSAAVTQAFPGWLASLGRALHVCSQQSGGEPDFTSMCYQRVSCPGTTLNKLQPHSADMRVFPLQQAHVACACGPRLLP